MAYTKFTMISGRNTDGVLHVATPGHGHWKLDHALRYARRHGIVGPVEVEHCVGDMSGLGRGGHDGKWRIDGQDSITSWERLAAWREGGHEQVDAQP